MKSPLPSPLYTSLRYIVRYVACALRKTEATLGEGVRNNSESLTLTTTPLSYLFALGPLCKFAQQPKLQLMRTLAELQVLEEGAPLLAAR